MRTAGGVLAKGRDPYFAPWKDVVQLNAFSQALHDALAEMLISVGAQCDGLRCDMAMLMTTEEFARTWGERARRATGGRTFAPGQVEGRRVRIPVFLGRGPDEPVDEELRAFYSRLRQAVADSDLRDGDWRLCDCVGWPDNDPHRQLVS